MLLLRVLYGSFISVCVCVLSYIRCVGRRYTSLSLSLSFPISFLFSLTFPFSRYTRTVTLAHTYTYLYVYVYIDTRTIVFFRCVLSPSLSPKASPLLLLPSFRYFSFLLPCYTLLHRSPSRSAYERTQDKKEKERASLEAAVEEETRTVDLRECIVSLRVSPIIEGKEDTLVSELVKKY